MREIEAELVGTHNGSTLVDGGTNKHLQAFAQCLSRHLSVASLVCRVTVTSAYRDAQIEQITENARNMHA